MLPVYVINLDRRPDRWRMISANLEQIGVQAERISGIDARLLAEQEQRGIERSNKPRWKINLGSAAGMMGHGKAMKHLIESDAPAALILEDDAELAADVPTLLNSTDWWPLGAKIVRLEEVLHHPRLLWRPSGRTPSGRDVSRLERWCGGAAAYLINREGARLALTAFANPVHTTDHTLFDLRVSQTARRLRPCQIVPAAARQRDQGASDIEAWRGRSKRRRGVKHILCGLPYKSRVHLLKAFGLVRLVEIHYANWVKS